jgi:hypothetical protein
LPVPSFRQGDDKWRDDPLGGVPENGTIGGEGCAVASAAMVFKFYGIDVDPQQLNWFLTATDGYTEQGWLYWDRAAWFAPDRVRHVYEDLPSYQLIDSNIAHGNPVIVRVRLGVALRILWSSQGKTVSIISCAIQVLALRKGFTRCENLAATLRRCDSTSPSRPRIRSCPRDADKNSDGQCIDRRTVIKKRRSSAALQNLTDITRRNTRLSFGVRRCSGALVTNRLHAGNATARREAARGFGLDRDQTLPKVLGRVCVDSCESRASTKTSKPLHLG